MKSIFVSLGILFSAAMMAQTTSTATDSVCAGSQDVVYGILNPDASSTYTWSLSDPAAGTIDNSLAPNDSLIQIDWGTTPGTYTLYAIETTGGGCIGDSVMLDIVINPLPTIAAVGDSVCSNTASQMTLTLTGEAPWIIDYTDGTNNYTDTASASPYVVSLPPYASTTNITITGLSDDNGCAADPAGLPSTVIYTFGKPSTG
ncbi:MAG: hypothetical protein ACPF9D_11840, partial [Owenweeksia sp.]